MLRNEPNEHTEVENLRRKQAALQTKGQKRWRAKGVDLDVLLNEYTQELGNGGERYSDREYPEERYSRDARAW